MNKPGQIRAFLAAAVPSLAKEPDRLKLFITDGRVVCTAAPQSVGFEYRYTLNLLLLDWAEHPDQVVLPLLLWLAVNQRDLVQSWTLGAADDGLPFEVDVLDTAKVDMQLKIPLSELVVATRQQDGGYTLARPPEPGVDPGFGPWPDDVTDPANLLKAFARDELVAHSDTVEP